MLVGNLVNLDIDKLTTLNFLPTELEVEDARNEEERLMIEHATSWLNKKKIEDNLDWQGMMLKFRKKI